ncbi:DUF599 family protein [Pokkaliibacter sp. MBI-7]|uniref:DUF599 domain-containing protein n=1 Tax=Proteobacteria bacterium 228 TaxID=2083153 RepID=A0A2S5KQN0_9PROT|nr:MULTISPECIES: DUF599 family protein [Pokkaliibacter]MDH2435834.1 DUF599 family protein [Pokkaliibacter sp. MBI-7]PPC77151.1 DUF599 domain-containing protein [Pokkaliibacter plantistimulans]
MEKVVAIWSSVNWQNLLALAWFLICFRGYTHYAIHKTRTTASLASIMHLYRYDWMKRMLERDNRIADMSLIANLERSVSFFASSTMLIVAGILTLMGTSEKALNLLHDLPLVQPSTQAEVELKLLVMICLFVYAFFKFTWSLRQYGFCSVLIGGAPMPRDLSVSDKERQILAARAAKICSMAANNFNFGLRSYYFGLALLGWFISPWLLMCSATLVVYVLYQREFRSSTLQELVTSDPSRI